jgi:hypothetical protein
MTDHDWQPLPGSQTLEFQTRNGRTRLRNRPGTLNQRAAGTSWKAPQRPPTAPTLTPTPTPNPRSDAAQQWLVDTAYAAINQARAQFIANDHLGRHEERTAAFAEAVLIHAQQTGDNK